MRIHLYGNVLNWAYQFGKLLRARGHDARVFLDRREALQVYRPEWEDAEVRNQLPEWVELVDVRMSRLLMPGASERLFLKRLGDCDVIQAFGEHAVWASKTGTPYGVLSYGGDLEILAFARGDMKQRLLAELIRRAFQQAAWFVYAIPYHRDLVERLKMERAVCHPHAVPVDTDKYRPLPEAERQALRAQYPQRLVFLHGARQEWQAKDANDKANDRLLRAFARFVKEPGADALLIAVERGRDVAASKALIASLGIASHVRWVPELDKAQLVRTLHSVDAFLDQFSHGYYGVAALEALACGVPTFTYLNVPRLGGISLPPVVNVGTEEEIAAGLRAWADRERLDALGRAGRRWVLEHHGFDTVGAWFEQMYEGIAVGAGAAA